MCINCEYNSIMKEIISSKHMTTSIQDKLKILPNYKILKDFENENYIIEAQPGNQKGIFKLKNKRKSTISFYDFWESGIGKIKKSIFEKNPNHWFIQKYGNFSGITLNDMVSDEKDFLNSKVILKNCRLENCKFTNLSIYPLSSVAINDTNICYLNLSDSIFIGCKFFDLRLSFDFMNNCSFHKCDIIKCYLFNDDIIRKKTKETNIYDSNFKECNFINHFDNINITNCSFVDSLIKYCSFELCTLTNNIFTECDLSGTRFNEKNTFIRNTFRQNIFHGTNFANIIFEENNSFKDNEYNIATRIESNYIKVYRDKGQIMDDLIVYNNISGIHYNFYNELKSTTMKEKAYEHYYIYKKLSMLEYLPTLFSALIYKLIFMDKVIKQVLIIILIGLIPNIFGAIISSWEYSIVIIISIIIFALIFIKFSSNFLSYIICGFGERPKRAFISMICVIIGCAYIFMHTGVMVNVAGGGNYEITYNSIFTHSYLESRETVPVNMVTFIEDYFRCLYFSVVTFTTIGFGDVIPISKWAKLLVMIEAVSSIFLINIFTATFIRKMIRD